MTSPVDLPAVRARLRQRDPDGARAIVDAVGGTDARTAAWVEQARAEIAMGRMDLDGAATGAQVALAWAQGEGAEIGLVAEALRLLGMVSVYRVEVGRARAQLERAGALFRQVGVAAGQADCARYLGYLDQETGRLADARRR